MAAMEDVLEVYAEAADPKRPRVNFDECSVELHKDVRPPEPVGPGRPARVDYEYERNGTANLFVVVDPNAGRRYVTVTERRTKADFARQMKALCDDLYPDADRVRVVLDNLNTHTAGALYEAFEPAEARRLAAKLEFHYTPKHASWLNMAELELSAVAGSNASYSAPAVWVFRLSSTTRTRSASGYRSSHRAFI